MNLKVRLATVLFLATLCITASASPINLKFSGSEEGMSMGFLWSGGGGGGTSEGWGAILQVMGPDGKSTQVDDGALSFTTAPADHGYSYKYGYRDGSWDAWGDSLQAGPGGSFSITGSVFGLAPETTLISGAFLWANCAEYYYDMIGSGQRCDSRVQTDYVNPTILQGFGVPPDLDYVGTVGALSGEFRWHGPGPEAWTSWRVGVSLVATPEPSAGMLAGILALVWLMFHLRTLCTRASS